MRDETKAEARDRIELELARAERDAANRKPDEQATEIMRLQGELSEERAKLAEARELLRRHMDWRNNFATIDVSLRDETDDFLTTPAPTATPGPWPPGDVLRKLVVAADHLLRDHNCDCHGHEETSAALDAVRATATPGLDPVTIEACAREAFDGCGVKKFDGETCTACRAATSRIRALLNPTPAFVTQSVTPKDNPTPEPRK